MRRELTSWDSVVILFLALIAIVCVGVFAEFWCWAPLGCFP